MEMKIIMVYCTVPDTKTGETIAQVLVQERFCACVNRLTGIRSHYIYEGAYCEESEELLLIKTTEAAFERLKTRIETMHPYDVPEIIATPITDGNEAYLSWLGSSVK